MEQFATQGAPVGKLVTHHLVRQIPAHEQASEETADGQHHLSCNEIEEIEQRTVADFKEVELAQRQRTYGAYHRAEYRNRPCGTLPGSVHLLMYERGGNLMERDERRYGRQCKQSVKGKTHHIAHYGQRGEGLLEHVGQRDEHKRRPRVGINAYGKGRREYHKPGQDGHGSIENADLHGRLHQVGLTAEIRRIGA